MKKHLYILLCVLCLGLLTSCGSSLEETQNSQIQESSENILPNTQEVMTKEITGDAAIVQKWDQIEVHYVGTLEDGEKFDSSRDRGQTLPFTVGAGQMIPGFDSGVVGMKEGETKTLTLPAAQAYGEKRDDATQIIPKKDLASFSAAGFTLEVGETLTTQMGNFPIIASDEENVTLDLNHPLAGKTLIFEVEMVKITKAEK